MKSKKLYFALFISLFFMIPSPSQALISISTWDGGGANPNWTTNENWLTNLAPSAGNSLVFPSGALRLNNTNDFAAGTDFTSLTLSGSGYNLGGSSSIDLSGGIEASYSAGTSLIQFDIGLLADQTFSVSNADATLRLEGDISNGGFDLTVQAEGDLELIGAVSGTGALLKDGGGILTLSGDSSYSGGTTITGGTLFVDNTSGSATGSGEVSLSNDSVLQGTGTISGDVAVNAGAQVQPGESPGVLGVGNIVFQADSAFLVEINGPLPGTEYSRLEVTGTVLLNDPLLRIALAPAVGSGDDFMIIDNDGSDAVSGEFSGLPEGATFKLVGLDDVGFKITYEGGDGNDVVLTSVPTISIDDVTVEEPDSGTVNAVFTLSLTEASDETITVNFATADGTATAPGDYIDQDGTVTFTPGQTTQTIAVIVNADSSGESDETFFVNLFGPSNASIAVDQGVGTITPSINPTNGGGCSLDAHDKPRPWISGLMFLSLGLVMIARHRLKKRAHG